MKTGWIYFIRHAEHDLIKIGFTVNPKQRIAALKATSGPLRVIGTIPGTLQTEKWLHSIFEVHRYHNEWFRVCRPILNFIRPLGIHEAFRSAPHGGRRKGAGRPSTIRHIKNYPQCPCAKCRAGRALKGMAS